ncbi:hypothetical protein CN449_15250 [Bacillus thuringiensis]|uniref:DUF3908 family protein n=1 Tax=Bacillus thuringiensis TaxID=1428 RepID=UPI000BFA5106|nr:DUF3908 family protein [Bacillus thuringiensis]PEW74020.1 hypothetical protein CN449_15250 [Bacillus thuringiensis]
MKTVEINDFLTVNDSINQAMRKERESEIKKVLMSVGKFHDYNSDCIVFYPQNLYNGNEPYKLYFFFKNELIIGESVDVEDSEVFAEVTRLNYKNINKIKLSRVYSSNFDNANAIEIVFNDGEIIKLDSLKDSSPVKVNSFINKIERIYTML